MPRPYTIHRPKAPRAFTLPSQRPATVAAMAHPVITLASRLDREADAELAMGHTLAAERLAHRAAELRGWGP